MKGQAHDWISMQIVQQIMNILFQKENILGWLDAKFGCFLVALKQSLPGYISLPFLGNLYCL